MKRRVYFDMDGVLADFYAHPIFDGVKREYGNYPEMYERGFFENIPLMQGALEAVRRIALKHDVWILTQPVKESAHSYSEKVTWICKHFPELHHKIVMTQDKARVCRKGDVLIDDNAHKWKDAWLIEGGVFIHFDENSTAAANWLVTMGILTQVEKGNM